MASLLDFQIVQKNRLSNACSWIKRFFMLSYVYLRKKSWIFPEEINLHSHSFKR